MPRARLDCKAEARCLLVLAFPLVEFDWEHALAVVRLAHLREEGGNWGLVGLGELEQLQLLDLIENRVFVHFDMLDLTRRRLLAAGPRCSSVDQDVPSGPLGLSRLESWLTSGW